MSTIGDMPVTIQGAPRAKVTRPAASPPDRQRMVVIMYEGGFVVTRDGSAARVSCSACDAHKVVEDDTSAIAEVKDLHHCWGRGRESART